MPHSPIHAMPKQTEKTTSSTSPYKLSCILSSIAVLLLTLSYISMYVKTDIFTGYYMTVKAKSADILNMFEYHELNENPKDGPNIVNRLIGRDDVIKEKNETKANSENKARINETKANSENKARINETKAISENKTRIGILIPSTTRKIKNPVLKSLSLVSLALPSITRTMEPQYAYTVYIGIDKGDFLETQIEELNKEWPFVKVVVVVKGGTAVIVDNQMAKQAYDEGMDYFVRINDDTEFTTFKWTSLGIATLQKYNPPNVGVVGPTCREGNTNIMTHDMVHRTHWEIFDYYYPPTFANWYSDDWITHVYQPNRSTKLPSWIVRHHVSMHGTRYSVDMSFHKQLVPLENEGRALIQKFLSKNVAPQG